MAAITITNLNADGSGVDDAAIYTSANAGGDTLANDGNTRVHVVNGNGGAVTVTFATSKVSPNTGLAIADVSQEIDSGEGFYFGPFDPKDFGSSIAITYNTTPTGISLAALKG